MKTLKTLQKFSLVFLISLASGWACGSGHQFSEPSVPVEQTPAKIQSDDATIPAPKPPVIDVSGSTSTLPKPVVVDPIPESCSTLYGIPGIANPFLAGMPDGTEIPYPASVDRAPINAPVKIDPTDKRCLQPGGNLFFRVEGKISHGTMADQESDADGIPTAPDTHTQGSLFNLSNVKAPINSLIGIFLDNSLPTQRAAAPETLDFNNSIGRNFKTLQPKLGQIFFIGDGKDADGRLQSFTVPSGTTRLYLAIMDAYEWNNNSGKLSGGILWIKQP